MPIPAGVIRDLQMAAVVTLILMAAQNRGSADLDGTHNSQLISGQPVGLSIGRAVLTENLRNLQAAGGSHPLCGLRYRLGCSIEGTDDLGQVQTTDMEIDSGRCG